MTELEAGKDEVSKELEVEAIKRAATTCGRDSALKPTNNSLLLAFDDWFIWENTRIIWSLTISVRDMIAQWRLTLYKLGLT